MAKILILCEYAVRNGGENSMFSTLATVRRAGLKVQVAAPPNGPLADELASAGIDVLPFRTDRSEGGRRSQDELRDQLREIIAQADVDLLHANSLAMSRLSGPVVADCNLPSIGHLRDIMRVSHQAMADLNCHRRLLAVSEATRQYHVAAGLDETKTDVLHNGVDLGRFRPGRRDGYLHRELQLSAESLLVGAIGQVTLRKGVDRWLEAARQTARRFPAAHFVLVGQRHSDKAEVLAIEASLHVASKEGELSGRLHWLGRRDDVARLLGELDVLVHAARQEPLGRVLLEAAATGTPIVATEVGGAREIFPTASEAAILVPPDDAEALAEATCGLLADRLRRQQLGNAARRRAEEAFDVEHSARCLVRHYQEVLGES